MGRKQVDYLFFNSESCGGFFGSVMSFSVWRVIVIYSTEIIWYLVNLKYISSSAAGRTSFQLRCIFSWLRFWVQVGEKWDLRLTNAFQLQLKSTIINYIFFIYFSFTHPIQDITVDSDLNLIHCEPDPNVAGGIFRVWLDHSNRFETILLFFIWNLV